MSISKAPLTCAHSALALQALAHWQQRLRVPLLYLLVRFTSPGPQLPL